MTDKDAEKLLAEAIRTYQRPMPPEYPERALSFVEVSEREAAAILAASPQLRSALELGIRAQEWREALTDQRDAEQWAAYGAARVAEALHAECRADWRRRGLLVSTQHLVDVHFEAADAILAALPDAIRPAVTAALAGEPSAVLDAGCLVAGCGQPPDGTEHVGRNATHPYRAFEAEDALADIAERARREERERWRVALEDALNLIDARYEFGPVVKNARALLAEAE